MSAPLRIRGLTIRYGPHAVVRGLDLTLVPGETYGLVGESGSGKSSVAYAAMGHLAPGGRAEGSIELDGREVVGAPESALRRLRGRSAAMVYQDPASALNPVMRVGRQLREAARDEAEIAPALARVRLPPEVGRRWPHQLSGGQRQRVVIAMALLARPRLLILDEPTTGLDATTEAEVLGLLAEVAARDEAAVLAISHDLGLVARLSARMGVLYAGQLVEEGPTRAVLRAPAHPYTRALLEALPGRPGRTPGQRLASIPGQPPGPGERLPGCAFAPRCRHALGGLCDAEPEPVAAGEGRAAACLRLGEAALDEPPPPAPQPAARAPGPTLVCAQGLARRFGRTRALAGVDLEAGRAAVTALVGESGSGKSTLARIVVGLEAADEGTARMGAHDLAALPARRRPAELICAVRIVFQNPDDTLNPARRIGPVLARALRRAGAAHGPGDIERLLAAVRLPPETARRYPAALSGGQRQRVAIARAIAGAPELVVADEPVSALDASVQAAVLGLLEKARRERGTAVLLVSHDLALVREVAHRVVVLLAGRVMEAGRVAEVFASPYHPYTEALLTAHHPPDPDHRPAILPNPPPGPLGEGPDLCPFRVRCHRRIAACAERPPPERRRGEHVLACHHDLDALERETAHAP